jgi:hypothetical protein
MPASNSAHRTGTWSLPKLDTVEIAYTTDDRFAADWFEPHLRDAQIFHGAVTGCAWSDDTTIETRLPLGAVGVAYIDLDDCTWPLREVLDSYSNEWLAYHRIVADRLDDYVYLRLVILNGSSSSRRRAATISACIASPAHSVPGRRAATR